MNQCILHFVSSLLVGGAERFVLDLAATQYQSGSKVTIVSFGKSEQPLAEEAKRLGLPVHLINQEKHIAYRNLFKLFEGYNDKIIHLHSPAVLSYMALCLPLLKIHGIKLIYTRHGSVPLSRLKWRLLHKWANFFVGNITFVSQSGLDAFYKQHRWNKNKLSLISNGALVPSHGLKNSKSPKGEGKIKLGSVGRMVTLKAQRHLLQAITQLPPTYQSKLEVHFFGDGPERHSLEKQSQSLIDKTSVIFHGSVLDREAIFKEIHILLVCSETEGLSLAIMEAMARGIPTVASQVGDNAKLVIPEKTGWLYEYGDIDALKTHLLYILEHPEILSDYALEAHRHIDSNFSLRTTQEAYQRLYAQA